MTPPDRPAPPKPAPDLDALVDGLRNMRLNTANEAADAITSLRERVDSLTGAAENLSIISARVEAENHRLLARATAAEAALAKVTTALRDARPLVEKWCHYQGNSKVLFDTYLGPIDAALKGETT